MGGATVGAVSSVRVYVCLPGWDPWVRDAMFERAVAFLKRARRLSAGVVRVPHWVDTSSELMKLVKPIVGRKTYVTAFLPKNWNYEDFLRSLDLASISVPYDWEVFVLDSDGSFRSFASKESL